MGFFDFFRKKDNSKKMTKKITTNVKVSYDIQTNTEIDPIYFKKLPNGLLPGEIVLLDWMSGKSLLKAVFPRYFEFQYGINAEKSAKKLVNNGFLEYASPEETLHTLTIDLLKEVLKKKDLKLSGKKADLIERIKENFSTSEIESLIKNRTLKISSKGQDVINEYYYIVPAHKNDSKDGVYNVASVIRFIATAKSKLSNSDISWLLFQKALNKHLKSKNYGLARNDFHNMASQLYREKRFMDSLEYFLRVFICDLSGLNNGDYISKPEYISIAPGIVSQINKIVTALEYDNSALNAVFNISWDKTRQMLPFHYLSKEICFQCLLAALEENDKYIHNEISQSYKKLDKKELERKYNLKFLDFD